MFAALPFGPTGVSSYRRNEDTHTSDSPAQHSPDRHGRGNLLPLTLTALGVVYGDIGTSPLYAFRECFNSEYGLAPTRSTVYGVLSLVT